MQSAREIVFLFYQYIFEHVSEKVFLYKYPAYRLLIFIWLLTTLEIVNMARQGFGLIQHFYFGILRSKDNCNFNWLWVTKYIFGDHLNI